MVTVISKQLSHIIISIYIIRLLILNRKKYNRCLVTCTCKINYLTLPHNWFCLHLHELHMLESSFRSKISFRFES